MHPLPVHVNIINQGDHHEQQGNTGSNTGRKAIP